MRASGYILAFYLMLLAITPCCIFDNCPEDKEVQQTESHKNGDRNNCGDCSPFSSCTGCNNSTIDHRLSVLVMNALLIPHIYSGFYPSDISDISVTIWQPPRLG